MRCVVAALADFSVISIVVLRKRVDCVRLEIFCMLKYSLLISTRLVVIHMGRNCSGGQHFTARWLCFACFALELVSFYVDSMTTNLGGEVRFHLSKSLFQLFFYSSLALTKWVRLSDLIELELIMSDCHIRVAHNIWRCIF